MVCPGCGVPLTAQPDSSGLLLCPSCGARLRTKPPRSAAEPGTPAPAAGPAPVSPAAASRPQPLAPTAAPVATLEAVLLEVRAVRRAQEEILGLLRAGGVAPPSDTLDGDLAFGMAEETPASEPPPLRTRRRKTVLLVDDDEATREAAVLALTQAEVPTRAFGDGNGAVSGIAAEKPDVIVLELGLAGSMGGRDVVNVVKSTMEWVDIPILLYTREPVASQKEARQVHGADEVVRKGPGSPAALVQRVIAVFRRG